MFPEEKKKKKKMSLMWRCLTAANEEADVVLIVIGGRVCWNHWAASPLMSEQAINTDISCLLLYSTQQELFH